MEDMFTAEQQKLERLLGVIKSMETATMPAPNANGSQYMQGYAAGVTAQHDLILTMLKAALQG